MSSEEDMVEAILTILVGKTSTPVTDIAKFRDSLQILSSLILYALKNNETPLTVLDTLLDRPSHLPSAPKRRKEINTKLMIGNNAITGNDLATLDGESWLNDKVIMHLDFNLCYFIYLI